jgi:hypothetical protein
MSYSPTVVKSTQEGTISLTNGASATATITAVNVDKTILSFNGTTTGTTTTLAQSSVRMSLTNSTTVTATRASTSNSLTINPQYRVVEFY